MPWALISLAVEPCIRVCALYIVVWTQVWGFLSLTYVKLEIAVPCTRLCSQVRQSAFILDGRLPCSLLLSFAAPFRPALPCLEVVAQYTRQESISKLQLKDFILHFDFSTQLTQYLDLHDPRCSHYKRPLCFNCDQFAHHSDFSTTLSCISLVALRIQQVGFSSLRCHFGFKLFNIISVHDFTNYFCP